MTSHSQAARKASRSAKNGFGALGALLEEPVLRVIELAGSSSQVSEAGQGNSFFHRR